MSRTLPSTIVVDLVLQRTHIRTVAIIRTTVVDLHHQLEVSSKILPHIMIGIDNRITVAVLPHHRLVVNLLPTATTMLDLLAENDHLLGMINLLVEVTVASAHPRIHRNQTNLIPDVIALTKQIAHVLLKENDSIIRTIMTTALRVLVTGSEIVQTTLVKLASIRSVHRLHHHHIVLITLIKGHSTTTGRLLTKTQVIIDVPT